MEGGPDLNADTATLSPVMRAVVDEWRALLATSPNSADERARYLQALDIYGWSRGDQARPPAASSPCGVIVWVGQYGPERGRMEVAKDLVHLSADIQSLSNVQWGSDIPAVADPNMPLQVILSCDIAADQDLESVMAWACSAFEIRKGAARRRCQLSLFLTDEAHPAQVVAGGSSSSDSQSKLELRLRRNGFQLIADVDLLSAVPPTVDFAERHRRVVISIPEARLAEAASECTGEFFSYKFSNGVDCELLSSAELLPLENGDPLFLQSNLSEYTYILIDGGIDLYYRRRYSVGKPEDKIDLPIRVARPDRNADGLLTDDWDARPVGDWELSVPLQRGRYEASAIASEKGAQVIRLRRALMQSVLAANKREFGWWSYGEFLRNYYDGAEFLKGGPQSRAGPIYGWLADGDIQEVRNTIFRLERAAVSDALLMEAWGAEISDHGQVVICGAGEPQFEDVKAAGPDCNALRQAQYIGWTRDGTKEARKAKKNLYWDYKWEPSPLHGFRERARREFEEWVRPNCAEQSAVMTTVLNYGRPGQPSSEREARIGLSEVITHISRPASLIGGLAEVDRAQFWTKAAVAFTIMRWLAQGDAIYLRAPLALHELRVDKPEAKRAFISRLAVHIPTDVWQSVIEVGKPPKLNPRPGEPPDGLIPVKETSAEAYAELAHRMLGLATVLYARITAMLVERQEGRGGLLAITPSIYSATDVTIPQSVQHLLDEAWHLSVRLLRELGYKDQDWNLWAAGMPEDAAAVALKPASGAAPRGRLAPQV